MSSSFCFFFIRGCITVSPFTHAWVPFRIWICFACFFHFAAVIVWDIAASTSYSADSVTTIFFAGIFTKASIDRVSLIVAVNTTSAGFAISELCAISGCYKFFTFTAIRSFWLVGAVWFWTIIYCCTACTIIPNTIFIIVCSRGTTCTAIACIFFQFIRFCRTNIICRTWCCRSCDFAAFINSSAAACVSVRIGNSRSTLMTSIIAGSLLRRSIWRCQTIPWAPLRFAAGINRVAFTGIVVVAAIVSFINIRSAGIAIISGYRRTQIVAAAATDIRTDRHAVVNGAGIVFGIRNTFIRTKVVCNSLRTRITSFSVFRRC